MKKSALVFFAAVLTWPLAAQTYRSDNPELNRTGFGTAVAVGDNEVLVGWPHSSGGPGTLPGDVVVFRPGPDGTWAESSRFSASDGTIDNRFSRAMAVHGNTLLLGATKQDEDLGAGYIFERTPTGEWRESTRLRPTDTADLQNYGRAVALSDEFALVSSVAYDSAAGIVFVFRRDPNSGEWSENARLSGSDVGPESYFGLSVALDGHTAVIGAPFQNNQRGGAFVFQYDAATDTWREAGKITGNGTQSNANFGIATAVMQGHAFVGAPGFQGGLGGVFIFGADAETGEWSQVGRLLAFDGAAGSQFGRTVAVGESSVWVGAPGVNNQEGRVYVFESDPDTHMWTGASKLAVEGTQPRDQFGSALAVRGNVAAVSIGNDDYGEGTVAVFQRDPTTGQWKTDAKVWMESTGMEAIAGAQVDCEGGTATLFDCGEVDLMSFTPVQELGGGRGVQVNDVWGWEDPETGKEWALVGRYDGTAFVDISNPLNPRYAGNLALPAGAFGNVWRDIKVYNDHAFIVSDGAGEHGMQVFDLRQLRDVGGEPVEFEETAHYDGIHSAHNIVINEETGYAYSVGSNGGGETCGGGLHMINIQEPSQPTFVGCFSDTNTGSRKTGYSHDAQCINYHGPDTEHSGKEICFGSNETALSIADVTDKENPVPLSMASYPNVGYAHQGWVTDDHKYFFMDDEGDELNGTVPGTRTLVWDIQDLDDPILAKEFIGTTEASDHNLYVRGNLVYQSNYVAGLRILDISEPENPREVGYFDTVPTGENVPGFAGSWSNYPFFKSGVIVVTSGKEGLFLLKKKETLIP